MRVPTSSTPQIQPAGLLDLAAYSQEKFTGCLEVRLPRGQQWTLYLSLGRLIWAKGGCHPVRRWRRHLIRYCPSSDPSRLPVSPDMLDNWDYNALVLLIRQQISQVEPIVAVVRGIVAEVMFDLVQATAQGAAASVPLHIEARAGVRPSQVGILPQTSTLDLNAILSQAQREWQAWAAAGLAPCSPDLAPLIVQSSQLKQQLAPQAYRNLSLLANGRRSLRDIAWMAKQEVLALARSLLPYRQQQLLTLQRIPDLPRPQFLQSDPPEAAVAAIETERQPLVACIDDDPQTGRQLDRILSAAGYRCLAIAEPVRALPLLLQHRPDFILLDLVMPIANGYEICTQIRRVSQFQTTPIVILTGRDGVVDRVRAKLAGATDFISKPIDAQQVLAVLRRYAASAASTT